MKKIIFLSLLTLITTGLFSQTGQKSSGIYPFEVVDIEGKTVKLSDFKGKTVLIVNVASRCGLTKQYEGLEALYKKYKDRGLVILGFPCNQFLGQEPGTDEEIASFCKLKYDVTFPMFSKIEINGENAHPLYKYLTSTLKGKDDKPDVEWNFAKFLIDKNGNPVKRFAPRIKPEDIAQDIESLL